MRSNSVSFKTFGCKVNQYEVDKIRTSLLSNGSFSESDDHKESNLIIINTCTVTEEAYKECLKFVKRIKRRNPQARVVVTGCAVTSNYDTFKSIEGINLFINSRKVDIQDFISQTYNIATPNIESNSTLTTRYFLKIQDGCDLNCSYCIIPSVRGTSKSRPLTEVIQEFKNAIKHGYKEIVLTGIHLGSYGKDLGTSISAAVSSLIQINGDFRIRLSSIEADEVKSDLINLFNYDQTKLCPHLHLPLQSGDDSILRTMRRRYNTKQYLKVIDELRAKNPDFGFTTDVIVGFPDESSDNFANTIKVLEYVQFHRIHSFPYSPRNNTDAYKLPDINPQLKKSRMKIIQELSAKLFRNYATRFFNEHITILIESDNLGYSQHYLKASVNIPVTKNTFTLSKVLSIIDGDIVCQPVIT
ncbi:MAG: tRNA (N(6)-L-threonylcarbamoyladenosine(37)-C(2))-methylthiotransferase MtaB [Planctomycetes bacterium]|nr:tRNA (N(6)-L-threonylcarbamoyladenosine(37)-C(2))-methylthiotransferase MtaB [Planctomycetota bacterium]